MIMISVLAGDTKEEVYKGIPRRWYEGRPGNYKKGGSASHGEDDAQDYEATYMQKDLRGSMVR